MVGVTAASLKLAGAGVFAAQNLAGATHQSFSSQESWWLGVSQHTPACVTLPGGGLQWCGQNLDPGQPEPRVPYTLLLPSLGAELEVSLPQRLTQGSSTCGAHWNFMGSLQECWCPGSTPDQFKQNLWGWGLGTSICKAPQKSPGLRVSVAAEPSPLWVRGRAFVPEEPGGRSAHAQEGSAPATEVGHLPHTGSLQTVLLSPGAICGQSERARGDWHCPLFHGDSPDCRARWPGSGQDTEMGRVSSQEPRHPGSPLSVWLRSCPRPAHPGECGTPQGGLESGSGTRVGRAGVTRGSFMVIVLLVVAFSCLGGHGRQISCELLSENVDGVSCRSPADPVCHQRLFAM